MVALDFHARGVVDDVGLREVVALVESFFVRRQLARIPTNALNKVFVQLLDRLPEDDSFVGALHREMSRDRLYWPSDGSIRQAVRTQPFFHIGRWHQRKLILERLERSFGHPEVIDFQEAKLQIEHIMPQSLSAEWREHLSGLGQDPDLVHQELVHTLGNLTLTAFNGTLSNNPFDRKQEIYGASHLEMNKALVENEAWGQDQILARADVLAEKLISIWPAPIPGVTSTSEGFDWSRVDAAIAAIPPGSWTSYGALAELAGRGAQVVGNYIHAIAGESNAYRVLTSNGAPSESFRWWDEGDDRDVRDVLTAEGVDFDESGRATEADWLSSAALTALIDAPEQDADEDAAFASAA
jgi:alkylated DNA nucleotide flippase Atl1